MLDCHVIDTKALKEEKRSVLAKWFAQNQDEIDNCTAKFLLNLLENGVKLPSVDQVPEYCNEDLFFRTKNLLYKYGDHRALPLLLPAVIAFSIRYDNTTCHEILFRQPHTLYLPKLECAFLKMIYEVSESDRTRVFQILQGGQEGKISLPYLIKKRVVALSNELGVQKEKFVYSASSSPTAHSLIRTFIEKPISPDAEDFLVRKNSDSNIRWVPLVRLVYLICATWDIAADYLLIHDYSELAFNSDGSTLTPYRRKLLSLFLTATPMAQEKAMQELLAASVRSTVCNS